MESLTECRDGAIAAAGRGCGRCRLVGACRHLMVTATVVPKDHCQDVDKLSV